MEKVHIIWQDAVYEDDAEWAAAYRDETGEECLNLSEFIADRVAENLDDARANLDIEVPEGIIPVADLGLWHGRKKAYGDDLHNVAECLSGHCGGYLKAYVEDGDLRVSESHHDGTNYYTFRKWRGDATDEQRDDVRRAIASQSAEADVLVEKYTEPLGGDVARVYGW